MIMNKDRIFGLFDSNPSGTKITDDQKQQIIAFQSTPYSKLGMFTKLVLNHFVFHDKLEKFLQKEEPTYDVESTREASNFVVFNRAYSYLNQINPKEELVINAVLNFNDKLLTKSLNSALKYFEELEEYEKCAHIFKFKEILKESFK